MTILVILKVNPFDFNRNKHWYTQDFLVIAFYVTQTN